MRYTPKYIKKLELLRSYIVDGEHENQDFKVSISSQLKIARTIAAFANTSGGRILIGVDDKGEFCKINIEEEMFMVDTAAKDFCKPSIEVKFRVHHEDDIEILEAIISKGTEGVHFVVDEKGNKRLYHRVKDQVLLIKEKDSQ